MSRLNEALTAIDRRVPKAYSARTPPALVRSSGRGRRSVLPVAALVAAAAVTATVGGWTLHQSSRSRQAAPVLPVLAAPPVTESPAKGHSTVDLRAKARHALTFGALDEATELLERALTLDRSDAATWNDLGVIRVRQGDYQRGIEAFERSLRLDAGRAETHRNLAVALDQDGERRRAVTHYRAFLTLAPAHPERAQVERRLAFSIPREDRP